MELQGSMLPRSSLEKGHLLVREVVFSISVVVRSLLVGRGHGKGYYSDNGNNTTHWILCESVGSESGALLERYQRSFKNRGMRSSKQLARYSRAKERIAERISGLPTVSNTYAFTHAHHESTCIESDRWYFGKDCTNCEVGPEKEQCKWRGRLTRDDSGIFS